MITAIPSVLPYNDADALSKWLAKPEYTTLVNCALADMALLEAENIQLNLRDPLAMLKGTPNVDVSRNTAKIAKLAIFLEQLDYFRSIPTGELKTVTLQLT